MGYNVRISDVGTRDALTIPLVCMPALLDHIQSMSRAADCYDKAVAESFFAGYKLECMPIAGFDSPCCNTG